FSSGQDGARPFKRQTNIVSCKHKNIIGKWTRKGKGRFQVSGSGFQESDFSDPLQDPLGV
ncbi:MAG: hypothetical protein WCD04_07525, partial [Terriglobia bacterium]